MVTSSLAKKELADEACKWKNDLKPSGPKASEKSSRGLLASWPVKKDFLPGPGFELEDLQQGRGARGGCGGGGGEDHRTERSSGWAAGAVFGVWFGVW